MRSLARAGVREPAAGPRDYSIRHPAQLRVFCTWVLPTEEALALLARDRAEYARHLGEIDHALAGVDWSASQQQRASRLVIEFGRRFYALQIEWIDWAAEQIAAGALQPGNPPPGVPATALPG